MSKVLSNSENWKPSNELIRVMSRLGFYLIDIKGWAHDKMVVFEREDYFYYAGGICSHGWAPKSIKGSSRSKRITFEDFFDLASDKEKDIIIFNFDLFIEEITWPE